MVVGTSCAGTESIAESQRGLDTEGTSGVSRKLQIKAAVQINGFGFGGQNASLVVTRN